MGKSSGYYRSRDRIVRAAFIADAESSAFTQTATYSIANQLGFFTAYGLNVTYLQVPNSTYGYAQLLNGMLCTQQTSR